MPFFKKGEEKQPGYSQFLDFYRTLGLRGEDYKIHKLCKYVTAGEIPLIKESRLDILDN